MPTKTSRFMKSKYLKSGFRFAEISCDKKLPVISRGVILILSLVLRPGGRSLCRVNEPGLASRDHGPSHRSWSHQYSTWGIRSHQSSHQALNRFHQPSPTTEHTGLVSPAELPVPVSPTSHRPWSHQHGFGLTSRVTRHGLTNRATGSGLISRAHGTSLASGIHWARFYQPISQARSQQPRPRDRSHLLSPVDGRARISERVTSGHMG